MLKNNLVNISFYLKVVLWVFLLYLFTNYDPWYPKCLLKMIFFYFKLVSGFLDLCQAKWNEISRTNPAYRSCFMLKKTNVVHKSLSCLIVKTSKHALFFCLRVNYFLLNVDFITLFILCIFQTTLASKGPFLIIVTCKDFSLEKIKNFELKAVDNLWFETYQSFIHF